MIAILIGLLLVLAQPNLVSAQSDSEEISLFSSEITINQDTSITTSEKIEYFTPVEKHGIYRYIPYRYNRNGLRYTTKNRLESITDERGSSIPYDTSHNWSNVTFKIGDPDKTFSGNQSYRIRYNSEDVLQQYDGYDELYLDITGEGWQIPISFSQARIESPFADITEAVCFSGAFGSNDSLCQVEILDPQTVFVSYDQTIDYGKNLTVAVKLDPDNQLVFPTPMEKLIKTILDNLGAIGLLLPLLWMGLTWYYKGRDQVFVSQNIFDMDPNKPTRLHPAFGRHRTPLSYQPMKDLTPGEAGAILDERVDNQDIIAEIIDLARKKYLKIEPVKTKKLLWSTKDFLFVQLKPADELLPKHQHYLHQQLFKTGKRVKLSKLKGTFYTTMAKLRTMIFDSVLEKGLFTSHPNKTRLSYLGLFAAMSSSLFIVGAIMGNVSPVFIVLSIFNFVSAIPFVISIVQKSAIGTNYFLQAKGLRETIQRGAWREKINEHNLFFSEVLPFAVAFKVVNQLSKDMDDLAVGSPEYLNSLAVHNMTTQSFINSFTSQANQSLSYNPSSSSSGGSGFSGGSSGGGFSGGGGGSW